MEVEPDSANEKNDFLNRQDMAIGFIYMSISPEILHQVCDVTKNSLQMNYGAGWRFYLGIRKNACKILTR